MNTFIIVCTVVVGLAGIGVSIWSIVSTNSKLKNGVGRLANETSKNTKKADRRNNNNR